MRLEPLFDQEMEQIKQEYEERIKTYEQLIQRQSQTYEEERRLLEQRIQEQIQQQRRTYEEERRTLEQRIQEQIQQQSQTYEQRILQEHRATIESMLRLRFGSIDEELAAIIEPFAALPSAEYSALILQLSNLSREELLTRFRR